MAQEIKNLKSLANKIKEAIKKEQKIILFADADLDGVASLIILEESIKCLGSQAAVSYFSDRDLEGYGLNRQSLGNLASYAPALLITLDCGISNFQEIKEAKDLGFEVVVVDHHQVLDKLPQDAVLIVDPKQPGDDYPFKNLANAGIVYFLAKLLLAKKMSDSVHQGFLELAALATIADMMEEKDDNKFIIEQGLGLLFNTPRPGLKALIALCDIPELNQRQVAQKIVTLLNITALRNHHPDSYVLLSSSSPEQSKALAEKLLQESRYRQELISAITAEIS